ncbi:hypothetical protein PoB_007000400 [Plakobranchus ocellatus]|uniref:Uncharacterized protein n=1 Tax=Plakobranchus ocellatus TaxID=259542 RepID=A0AAV4DHJ8_9GAST|nr:hypothetical protein PoB_007000400 [Plakobranchus ocellatus]
MGRESLRIPDCFSIQCRVGPTFVSRVRMVRQLINHQGGRHSNVAEIVSHDAYTDVVCSYRASSAGFCEATLTMRPRCASRRRSRPRTSIKHLPRPPPYRGGSDVPRPRRND